MRQIAYSSAVGCGCLFGADAAQVHAAEWSVAPSYAASVDYDSNRRLAVDAAGTESALVTADLNFKRSMENTDIFVEPRYTLRRYSDSSLGNGDDRSLSAGLDWRTTGTRLNLTASIMDQSTLISELLETGIVRGDTHQRVAQVADNWTWTQSERRQLISQIAYSDVSYYGQGRQLLPGYRYPSGSVGERVSFSETGSFTLSAYGSALSSDAPGGSSHEAGLEAQLVYDFSDRTHFDGTLGESARRLSGVSSHGTDITASLIHDLYRGSLTLGFTRSLVPYGIGFLVEREQFTASGIGHLTEHLDATISLQRVQNDQRTVLLGIDRRSYDDVVTGLNWHLNETWTLGMQLSAIRTQPPGFVSGTVNEWRSSVILGWTPHPATRSW